MVGMIFLRNGGDKFIDLSRDQQKLYVNNFTERINTGQDRIVPQSIQTLLKLKLIKVG